MRPIKFVHFSDLHLDSPFTSIGPDVERISQRRQDLIDVFDVIIDMVKRENTDLLLISGDLYEHFYVKKSTINHVNCRFREIEDTKVFIVPGNHDPYVKNSYYKNFEWNSNVYILSEERPKVELFDMNVCIYGLGFGDFYKDGFLSDEFKADNDKLVNILLVHGTVDMNFTKKAYNLLSSEELSKLNMDYIALGHFHNRIDDLGQKGVIYNPGSPEPLGFDEEGEHGIFKGTVSKSLLDVEYVCVNRKQYRSLSLNLEGINSDEHVVEKIRHSLGNMSLENSLVSIKLKGYTSDEYRPNKAKIKRLLEGSMFYFDVEDKTIPGYNYDELRNEPGLKGLYVRKLLEMVYRANSEKERYLLMKSLYYGVEALEKGRIEEL
ncbi:metallophosphoesterase family protein [Acetivibrio cellulolyticus]|uniref:metallophosphoesterase family protein n=1 Tax=Acetivibrio cellulolyticus TaxID=35830 RepID=UPI0001E2F5B2|nr:DNA repair exonuclease [Acetivibrio cellulolyticus]